MISHIGEFSSFSDEVYKGLISKKGGALDYRAVNFSEKFALRLVKSVVWIKRGKHHEEREFLGQLFSERIEDEDVDFWLDLTNEREFADLLIAKGVIKTPSKCKRRLSLAAELTWNAVFLTATSPISLPVGAAAIALRYAVQKYMHHVTCLRPKMSLEWDPSEGVSLLTANIAGSPEAIMNWLNGVAPIGPRLKGWSRILLNCDADVICLQEAFDTHRMYNIAKKLQAIGYYVVMTPKPPYALGLGNNLMLATKLEPIDVGFHIYPERKGWDARANKGVLAVTLKLTDEKTLCVATTHMQAGYSGATEEQKIQFKTKQFHFARRFIGDIFLRDKEVDDVLLLGDYNVSRFNLEGIDGVVREYSYPAMVDGLLRPVETQAGFKDLTVPNVADTFKTYLKKEINFEPIPENEETGCSRGSCFNSSAPSYRHFVPLIRLKVENATGLSEKKAKKLVKRRLEGKSIKNEDYSQVIDQIIAEVIDEMYLKANVVDHCSMMKSSDTLLSEVDYEYRPFTPVGKTGVLTDHRAVWFTIPFRA